LKTWQQIGNELHIAPQTANKTGRRALAKIGRGDGLVDLFILATLWEEARRAERAERGTDAPCY
jgi:hypothetical protein